MQELVARLQVAVVVRISYCNAYYLYNVYILSIKIIEDEVFLSLYWPAEREQGRWPQLCVFLPPLECVLWTTPSAISRQNCSATHASWIDRAQRFRLLAIASSSTSSFSEDALSAILACLEISKSEELPHGAPPYPVRSQCDTSWALIRKFGLHTTWTNTPLDSSPQVPCSRQASHVCGRIR